jgi:hypothetical protein
MVRSIGLTISLKGNNSLPSDIKAVTGKFSSCLFVAALYKKVKNNGQPKKCWSKCVTCWGRRCALRTEQAYCDWIRRYVKFQRMTCREDLTGGKAKVEAFLTDLAVAGKVAPSTQNQALNAFSRAP